MLRALLGALQAVQMLGPLKTLKGGRPHCEDLRFLGAHVEGLPLDACFRTALCLPHLMQELATTSSKADWCFLETALAEEMHVGRGRPKGARVPEPNIELYLYVGICLWLRSDRPRWSCPSCTRRLLLTLQFLKRLQHPHVEVVPLDGNIFCAFLFCICSAHLKSTGRKRCFAWLCVTSGMPCPQICAARPRQTKRAQIERCLHTELGTRRRNDTWGSRASGESVGSANSTQRGATSVQKKSAFLYLKMPCHCQLLTYGCGSKSNYQGTAGFSPCVQLPGFPKWVPIVDP